MAKEKIEIIVEATDKASRTLQGIGGSVLKVGAIAGGAALAGVTALGAGMVALAADAEPIIGLQKGFTATTERMGVATDSFMASMQDASGGLITNRQLMESVNKAAALVGTDFAKTLPDAMSLVQKAATSTGQDFGFLMDSLVTGVGRVSPMILDNLGIQVQLSQVTERASEMFGKQAEELSKTEQQMALNEIVLEKLNEAYGNVPDVSQPFAKIRTSIENVKDTIGVALATGLAPFAEMFSNLVSKIGPKVIAFFEGPFANVLSGIRAAFGEAMLAFEEGGGIIGAVVGFVDQLLYEFGATDIQIKTVTDTIKGLWETLTNEIIPKILEVKDTILEFLDPIIRWIRENVELKDVLIVLGGVIAATIIPAIISFLAPIAAVVAAIAGLTVLVAAVRKAWETDWNGIRTKLTEAWEGTIKPALEQLWAWLQVNIPKAIETLRKFWENVLLPAIQNVWSWINGTLIPFFQNVVFPWLQEKIPAAIQTLSNFWTTVLLPAINNVWAFLSEELFPLFQSIAEFLGAVFDVALMISAGIWQNVLQPAIETVWDWLENNILPILKDVWDFLKVVFNPILEEVSSWFGTVSDSVGGLSGVIATLKGWFDRLKTAIESLPDILPDWMTPGSPTPLEMGLRGINAALIDVNRNMRPFNLQMAQIGNLSAPMMLPSSGGMMRQGQTSNVTNHYHLNVQSGRSAGRITDDFDLMRAMAR